jgi:hypothetical protein
VGFLDVAPSFEEMGESINEVIKENLKGCTGIADEVSLSVHYQLVLACAWLNLKVNLPLTHFVNHCGGN